jgi:hypothetical protein
MRIKKKGFIPSVTPFPVAPALLTLENEEAARVLY